MTTITARLTAVESAPWNGGDGLTGREIWGRCDDPRDDGDHFTYRRAVHHVLRGAETAADAYAAARAVGLSSEDLLDELQQAAEDDCDIEGIPPSHGEDNPDYPTAFPGGQPTTWYSSRYSAADDRSFVDIQIALPLDKPATAK